MLDRAILGPPTRAVRPPPLSAIGAIQPPHLVLAGGTHAGQARVRAVPPRTVHGRLYRPRNARRLGKSIAMGTLFSCMRAMIYSPCVANTARTIRPRADVRTESKAASRGTARWSRRICRRLGSRTRPATRKTRARIEENMRFHRLKSRIDSNDDNFLLVSIMHIFANSVSSFGSVIAPPVVLRFPWRLSRPS